MTTREFMRRYFFKVLLIAIVIEIGIFAYLQNRNHKPEANNDYTEVYAYQSVEINATRNDTDKEEAELSLQSFDSPKHGIVKIVDGRFVYTPEKAKAVKDSFCYTVFDGKKTSKPAWVIVQVKENNAPLANSDKFEFYPWHNMVLDVLNNDEDKEDDTIKIIEYSNPLHGELLASGNQLMYRTSMKVARTDSFTYIASDGFNHSTQATVVINIKDKNDPNYPWLSSDVGNPSIPGNLKCDGNRINVTGSGSDIWGNADNFHFAYQIIEGDCEMITKLINQEITHEWTKAGIMFRESLSGGSKHAFVCITGKNGSVFHRRTSFGDQTHSTDYQKEVVKAPYWLKLVRKDNLYSAYLSPNGKSWTELDNVNFDMPEKLYVGLAVTSHDDGKLCIAVFNKNNTLLQKR